MTIDEDHDNYYRVDYFYAFYDAGHRCWYEDDYFSKPFATEDEARTYANQVIQRANVRPKDIKLYKLIIIYIDQEYCDECGDVRIVQHFDL